MMKMRLIRRVILLFVIFLWFCSAFADTSLFVATDRHAQYEKVPAESRSGSGEEKKKHVSHTRPVYDSDGNLIWHDHLTEILQRVQADGLVPDIVLLGGDFVGEGGDKSYDVTGYPMGAPYFSMASVESQIRDVFGDNVRCLFTYGSHDRNAIEPYESAFFSGPVKKEGYYLYGITYAQMIFCNSQHTSQKGYEGKDLDDPHGHDAQTATRDFLHWAGGLEDHLPIIIMSHVPLHAARGDNLGAWLWTQALNTVARDHTIVFLWGHNHTLEKKKERKETEQSNYLKMPGEMLTVQNYYEDKSGYTGKLENKLITRTERLRFLYMNAGYIINGAGTVLTFRDVDKDGEWDELLIRRYTSENEKAELRMHPLLK